MSAPILRDTHGTSTRTTGHRLGAILDPERNTVAVAAAAAWLALMAGLVVSDDVEGATDVGVARVIGGALVVVGYWLNTRTGAG